MAVLGAGAVGSCKYALATPSPARHAVSMARVTKNAWFGPKRWGWGWSPASWQGWVATIVFAVAGQVLKTVLPPRRAVWATLGMVAAFMGLVVLTGDPPDRRGGAAASTGEA